MIGPVRVALVLGLCGIAAAGHAQSIEGVPPRPWGPEQPIETPPPPDAPEFLKEREPVKRSRDRSDAEIEAASRPAPVQCSVVLRPQWDAMRMGKAEFGRALNSMILEARREAAAEMPALYYFQDSGTVLLAVPGDCSRAKEAASAVTSRLQGKMDEPLRIHPPQASLEAPSRRSGTGLPAVER